MNRASWRRFLVVVIFLLLAMGLLKRECSAEPGTTVLAAPSDYLSSSQGTEAQIKPDRGEILDDPQLFNSQETLPSPISTQAITLEDTARFYHIPGSVLTPVNSVTSLVYDNMGCVHVSAGEAFLLNAPLEIPHGSQIVLLRLYYDDTSATKYINSWITRYNDYGTSYQDLVHVPSLGDGGHSSNYGELDHIVDTQPFPIYPETQ